MLRHGLEAADLSDADAANIERHERTGRPWGDLAFLDRLEALTGRTLKPQRPGRKKRPASE
jgi:putative transposase